MHTSQRELNPLQTKGVAFAALPSNKVGRIIDITPEGLSFRYFHDASQTADDSQKVITVSIFREDGFSLMDLPCRIVTDQPLLREYKFNLVRMYRCHLRFEGLTARQKAQLDFFSTHCVNIGE